jgi:hypothetical protein
MSEVKAVLLAILVRFSKTLICFFCALSCLLFSLVVPGAAESLYGFAGVLGMLGLIGLIV